MSAEAMYNRWATNPNPRRISVPAHGRSVVTCLLISHGRIITASDNHSIHVHSLEDGKHIMSLLGHEGGVWTIAATKQHLVSGSTDRSVRVWDLSTGRCTHTFWGHTSTVRTLTIVKPEWVDGQDVNGQTRREKYPERPMIVSGSRDHTLRVWTLPRPDEPEYVSGEHEDGDAEDNPYHKHHLEGHQHAVRALAARGRVIVSGSYDSTVRVWDIVTGGCKWVLSGHTQKVYCVVLESERQQAFSGSMDGTVRVWNLQNAQCLHVLTGHTSLVGLLGLSPSYLVSAAADSTLRVWDPVTGDLRHEIVGHLGAITCFQHDDYKIVSGSDGRLALWDVREGTFVRDLLSDRVGVWQVAFKGKWCVAASNVREETYLDVWDFGDVHGDQDANETGDSDDDVV